MKRINFKEIEVFTDISRTKKVKGDGRKEFADLLYTACNGIEAHALAFKIFGSDGEIEVSEQEEALILIVAQQRCTPAFIDAIRNQLTEQ